MRRRPCGWPVMYQTWDKLLFLHWPVAAERLRPLVPRTLELDTFDGVAWVGVTPFTIRGIRPPLVPALPRVSSSHELNVRTYVHREGAPGVWFLSLDASNWLAVWGARVGFSLPYFHAAMLLESTTDTVRFRSRRAHRGASPANFEAAWTLGGPLPEAAPGTRDFFLIERYCLYATSGEQLYRARIHHRPWPLCTAHLTQWASSMIESHGLGSPEQAPLVHALGQPLHVRIWPLERADLETR